MNAMRGDGQRLRNGGVSVGVARAATVFDAPPDPFEDVAAPPLRVTPAPPRRAETASGDSGSERRPEPLSPDEHAGEEAAAFDALEGSTWEAEPEPEWSPVAARADAPPPDAQVGSSAGPVVRPGPDVPKPALALGPRPTLAPPPRRRSAGARQLRFAVVAGLALAIGIVSAALVLRPAPAATDPAAAPTTLGSGPTPAPAAVGGSPAVGTPVAASAVRLRVGPDLPADRQAALAAAIEAAGYGGLDVAPMPFPIERSRIEFFHPADRAAAEALARSLGALTGAPLDVRDLAEVTIGAEPGRIDVWVAR